MVKIHMLNKGYAQKPDKKEIAWISKNVTGEEVTISIDDFAKEAGINGKPFTPAVFSKSRQECNFLHQQVYAIDMDGDLRLDDFLERARGYQVLPVFVYATYSYTKQKQRFRAVFINDCEIDNPQAARILLGMLLQIFPEADQSCKDLARLFFGGKGLLYLNTDAVINIKDVAIGLQAFVKNGDSKNYGRKINKIGKDLGIAVEDNLLCVYDEYEIGENEEKKITSNSNLYILNQNSSKYGIIFTTHYRPVSIRHQKPIPCIQHKSQQDLLKACPLAKDFFKRDIPHEHKFLLATNLLYIKGGKRLFFDGLRENASLWKIRWDYFVKKEYSPESCKKGNCPYTDQCKCKNLIEKLTSKIQRIQDPEEYISEGEATEILHRSLREALHQPEMKIYLIQAQTALGKTTAYCKAAKENWITKPLMIVVPTNKLQQEVLESLTKEGVEASATPDVKALFESIGLEDLKEDVMELYQKGYSYKVKKIIRKYIKEHSDMGEIKRLRLEEYLKAEEKLDGKNCIVTTHAKFLSMKKEILERYEVVIDEDILMTLFKSSASIRFTDINEILENADLSEKNQRRLREIMNLPEEYVGYTKLEKLSYNELDTLYEKELLVSASVADFMSSDVIHVSQEERIDFFNMRELPDIKMIVVSATMDEKLYRDCFKNRTISYTKIPSVKYKGTLKQYTAYSMSRTFIKNMGKDEILEKVYQLIGNRDINKISFKMVDENSDIYFGKTEGFNECKGKDLMVLGTPHNVPFIYKMIGKYLGYDICGNLNNRQVEHGGYQFKVMTYENEEMQNLQFYFLESELEQAVGRARLLRCDCTVFLFSNFPCNQAEIIQEDYLEKTGLVET